MLLILRQLPQTVHVCCGVIMTTFPYSVAVMLMMSIKLRMGRVEKQPLLLSGLMTASSLPAQKIHLMQILPTIHTAVLNMLVPMVITLLALLSQIRRDTLKALLEKGLYQ